MFNICKSDTNENYNLNMKKLLFKQNKTVNNQPDALADRVFFRLKPICIYGIGFTIIILNNLTYGLAANYYRMIDIVNKTG